VRLNQGHQISPGNHPLRFLQKLTFALPLGDQIKNIGVKAFFHPHLGLGAPEG
jgi:hypothetical protein